MTFWVMKEVAIISNDRVTFLGNKLGQTGQKGHCDLGAHEVGHGNILCLVTFGIINKVNPTAKDTFTFGVIKYVTATSSDRDLSRH